ncbi:MAG: hypothetical protein HYT87_04785 [Nitrospirae bacterium]|nr:hypothetical protein [Nitrospirota bacterium]
MSGIAGILHFDGTLVGEMNLQPMLDALAHRGPDGSSVFAGGEAGLGHLMVKVDGTTPRPISRDGITLVMDGRIDNADLLKKVLRRRFGDRAETTEEVVWSAYGRWGENFPRWLLGDFAIAIWDANRERLLLVRDPAGVKPVFYRVEERRFIFASEAKAILAVDGVPCRPCESRLEEYDRFRFRGMDFTFYEGIRRVLPAEAIGIEKGRILRASYWHPPTCEPIRLDGRRVYLRRFRKLFMEAVRCRMPGKGDMVVTLSGGLDSTSITAAALHAKRGADGQGGHGLGLHTISGVPGRFPDESRYFGKLAEMWNLPNIVVDASAFRLREHVDRLAYELETPFVEVYDPNYYEGLFRRAADLGRVLLVGLWGDEAMMGTGYLGDLLRSGQWGALWKEFRILSRTYTGGTLESLRRMLRFLVLPGLGGHFYPTCNQRELHSALFGLYNLMALESADLGAAFRGIEVRYPFLDRRLVEFAFAVPAEERVRDGIGKRLMRDGLAGILPDFIASRKGKGDWTDFWEAMQEEAGLPRRPVGRAMRPWRAFTRERWEEIWFGTKGSGEEPTRRHASSPMATFGH